MPIQSTVRYPNPLEKRSQLERLLASRQFKKSPKLSELLTFLVESHLTGIAVDQSTVGIQVFDRRENWYPTDDNTVREGMRRLRLLLRDYYEQEGVEDRLNIEFDQYNTIFSYNLRHPVERSMRLAARYIGSDPAAAFSHLNRVLSIEPQHAEALAGWAEAEIWRIFYGYDMRLPAAYKARDLQVKQALESDPKCWRAHVVSGALHCCRKEWLKARSSFDAALRSSPEQTRAHPWYAGYLMVIGESRKAMDLVKAKASEPSDSPWPQLIYAVFLYAARQNTEALRVVREAVIEEGKQRFFTVVQYLILFAQEGYPSAKDRSHLGALLSIRPETDEQWFPIFTFLCYTFILDPMEPDYEQIKDGIMYLGQTKLAAWTRPENFSGDPHGKPLLSPIQLAIGYLSIGDADRAIKLLEQDVEAGHPFAAWLHLWPIFDPLRELPAFKSLIESMKIPDGDS